MLDERAKKLKVACEEGSETPAGPSPTQPREHVTLLLNCNASGDSFTSTVIFPLVNLPPLQPSVQASFYFAGSEKGWIKGNILKTVMVNTFIRDLNDYKKRNNIADRWTMILLDGHTSRNILEEEDFKNKYLIPNKIILDYIIPHSSHLIQPLDLSPNLRFKVELAKLKKRNREELTKMDSQEYRNEELLLAKRALSIGLSESSILDGWERTVEKNSILSNLTKP